MGCGCAERREAIMRAWRDISTMTKNLITRKTPAQIAEEQAAKARIAAASTLVQLQRRIAAGAIGPRGR